ncbi:Cyclic nucleotide-binding domain-containing protein [Ruminococcaceae bacterium YRB3002]|nr:Cyclic nucleotide-binding domain-containing protein [Ruminococcaceae bacterium YRB3002]
MALVEKTFKNGEIIIKEGDNGNSFFQLVEGNAFVYAGFGKDDQVKLALLEEGEYFGEMAILEAYPRSATIVAKGTVTAIEIPKDDLNAFFKEDPGRIIELMTHLGNRVCAMANDYEEAQNLLAELRKSDEAKKNKSLFSKIKKHIDAYQSNKNKLPEPSAESLREAFAALKDDRTGNTRSYGKGLIIFKEGAVDNCMYILHNGTVGMYNDYRRKEETKIAEFNAVAFFGEMGIISDEPRSATAVAEVGDTVVEAISPEDLENIFRSCPGKIELILRHLSYRLRRLNIDFLDTCKEITELYNKK